VSGESQHITGEQLCALTGLTDRRHRQIAKEGYFPPPINGEYQFSAAIQGMFRYYRELSAKRSSTLEDEKQKKLAAERKISELNLARMRGELLDASGVEKEWGNIILTTRQKLLGMENKISTRLGFTDEQRKGLSQEVEETLKELSRPTLYNDNRQDDLESVAESDKALPASP
tara:strand:- start:43 stop:561 length:519 start_codon:yes stop_codon:yes gene_type:complete